MRGRFTLLRQASEPPGPPEGVRREGAKRARFWVSIAAVAVVVWLAMAAAAILLARRDLGRGVEAVSAAREHAQDVLDGRELPELTEARRSFSSAHRRVSGLVLAPARVLPFFGRQVASVRSLADAARQVTDAGIDAVATVRTLSSTPTHSNADRAAVARRLADVAGELRRRLGVVDLGPRVGLLPPLARARNDLAGKLDELDKALRRGGAGARAGADLIGGPRRYLVLAANNAEMRAGTGMFLSAGELETGPAGIKLGPMQALEDIPVPPAAVVLEGDLRDRWGWLAPNEEWRNLMLSPRFDAQAPLAASMWVATGHRPVDGVLALDPVALRGLLEATGPVTVEDGVIGSDDVVDELLLRQYRRYSSDQKGERREALGRLAAATFDAIDAGRWTVAGLAKGLRGVIDGRHLLAWSSNVEEQERWREAGLDGSLKPESLLVSVLNRGGNKLDYHLRVTAELRAARAGDANTDFTLRLEMRNVVGQGEPRYVSGPHEDSPVGEGVYLGIVSVTLPGDARGGRVDGEDQLVVAGADGPNRVVGVELQVPRGEQRQVVVRFRMPRETGVLRVEPSARVPPTAWSSGSLEWEDTKSRLLQWG